MFAGYADVMNEIRHNTTLGYANLISLLRQADLPLAVRSLAGCALAAFGYNNKINQADIADAVAETRVSNRQLLKPLYFADFKPLLQCDDDDAIRCQAAFQVHLFILFIKPKPKQR
jgi:hypothetical protein